MATKFEAWITKYALTKGITKVTVEDCFDISEDMVKDLSTFYPTCYHGNDWHRTEADAVRRGLQMVKASRTTLEQKLKTMDKLEAEFKAKLPVNKHGVTK